MSRLLRRVRLLKCTAPLSVSAEWDMSRRASEVRLQMCSMSVSVTAFDPDTSRKVRLVRPAVAHEFSKDDLDARSKAG